MGKPVKLVIIAGLETDKVHIILRGHGQPEPLLEETISSNLIQHFIAGVHPLAKIQVGELSEGREKLTAAEMVAADNWVREFEKIEPLFSFEKQDNGTYVAMAPFSEDLKAFSDRFQAAYKGFESPAQA